MRFRSLLAIGIAVLGIAAPAAAQGSFSFGFGRIGCRSGFGVGFTIPIQTHRCWVPGHYETVATQVWVPGATRHVWVEPAYSTCIDPCGNVTTVVVRQGHYRTIQDPGHYETRYVEVWVPGHYR